ncbi:CCHC-type domain-containing protein [Trichonephila clavipes]|nr:CCHC-type domain-containing protein [Trichonephila clavipes]
MLLMQPFPKHPIPLESCANHGGTLPANKPKKEQRRAWGIFRRYPTTDNLIAFKRAKALARRIRRQCQRESWIKYVSSITSSTTSQQLWRKRSKQRMAFIGNLTFRYWKLLLLCFRHP